MAKQKPIPEEFLALMAGKFRMLGDSTRLAILHSLMGGEELNVSQIVAVTHRNVANVSKHLKQLADGGFLTRTKNGPFVLYRMNDPVTERICGLVCDSLQREIELQVKQRRQILARRLGK
jgi:DNA-binding transcriptional ArsR family regulator